MNRTQVVWLLFRTIAFAAAIGGGSLGCANGPERSQEISDHDRELLRSAASTRVGAVEWRAVVLPDLLEWFAGDSSEKWRRAREMLLADTRTPSRRMQEDGTVRYGYIVERLQAGDWDAEPSRRWLVLQGEIYRQLARFNSDNSHEWRAARLALTELGTAEMADPHRPQWAKEQPTATERCAFDLVLRLLSAQPDSADTSSGRFSYVQPQRGVREADRLFRTQRPANADWADEHARHAGASRTDGPLRDKSLWAMNELVEMGMDAVNSLIWGSYLAFTIGGPDADRFQENIWRTMEQMGETVVGGLLIDLDNSARLSDRDFAFVRVRRILRALATIYGPDPHTNKRPEWQEKAAYKAQTLDAIGNVLRHFNTGNEDRQFQISSYGIIAIENLGDPAGAGHLVWLWERAEADGEDDLINDIRAALRRLTRERHTTLRQWKAYLSSSR